MLDRQQVLETLEGVNDPELNKNIVELGMVRDVQLEDGRVSITLALTTLACPLKDRIVADVEKAVRSLDGVQEVKVNLTEMTPEEKQRLFGTATPQEGVAKRFNNVRKVVAVMSGKGGVGKSLVAALLASHLRRRGYKVGLLDADITGPSIPKILGITERPLPGAMGIIPPQSSTGIKVISIGLFLPSEDDAVIWRGPLISRAIQQFWGDVFWGDLDYLIVDLPPGTADASLTVMQSLPLNGIILVTSPQELVKIIVKKAMKMAQHLHVPIIGVVENMSYAICPDTGKKWELFGPSKAKEVARELRAPLLAQIPIDPEIARLCDQGRIEEYESSDFARVAERFEEMVPEVQPRFFVGPVDFSGGD